MLTDAQIVQGRQRLSGAFLINPDGSAKTPGQRRVFTRTSGSARPDDGSFADVGDPRAVCLYRPKGDEIVIPAALMDRTVFMMAWDDTTPWGLAPQNEVVIEGITYQVHDIGDERTNQFLSTAMVSRLK